MSKNQNNIRDMIKDNLIPKVNSFIEKVNILISKHSELAEKYHNACFANTVMFKDMAEMFFMLKYRSVIPENFLESMESRYNFKEGMKYE